MICCDRVRACGCGGYCPCCGRYIPRPYVQPWVRPYVPYVPTPWPVNLPPFPYGRITCSTAVERGQAVLMGG